VSRSCTVPPAPFWPSPARPDDAAGSKAAKPGRLRFVPALTPLLERLRRLRLPPGAAAGMLAVPSAGDELVVEVAFLFGDLDEIERHRETLVAAARSDATRVERAASERRARLLTQAAEEGERRAQALLADRRRRAQESRHAILAKADQEAERILARGRERTPRLVDEIVKRLLEDAP
jgi:vacuolar-type H+-ATPase subunit H